MSRPERFGIVRTAHRPQREHVAVAARRIGGGDLIGGQRRRGERRGGRTGKERGAGVAGRIEPRLVRGVDLARELAGGRIEIGAPGGATVPRLRKTGGRARRGGGRESGRWGKR